MKKSRKLVCALLSLVMLCSLLPAGVLAASVPEAAADDARLMSIPTGTAAPYAEGIDGTGVKTYVNGAGGTLHLNDGAAAGSTAYIYGSFDSANDTPAVYVGSGWTAYIGNGNDGTSTTISAVSTSGGKVFGVTAASGSTVTVESGTINASSTNGSVRDEMAYGVYAEKGATINIGGSPALTPSATNAEGPQISTVGAGGNFGVTALGGSVLNLHQGNIISQGVNSTAVYVESSTVNVSTGNSLGGGRTSPALQATGAVCGMSIAGGSEWSITGVGAGFSGATALKADGNSAGAGRLAGGTFVSQTAGGFAIWLGYTPIQNELKENYYLRNDAAGDYYGFSNGSRAVSAAGYSVSGTVSVVDAEAELVNAMGGTVTNYVMPCNVKLTLSSLSAGGVRSLDLNGKNLEYDSGECVINVIGELTITDSAAYQYTNIGSAGPNPAGIVRHADSGSAIKNSGVLNLGTSNSYGPMITAYAASSETSATVAGVLSSGTVNVNSASIYGTCVGAECDNGVFNVSAGSSKNEYTVICGKVRYGLAQFGGIMNIYGGIITLDASSSTVNSTNASYPWALYMQYGSTRSPIENKTFVHGGYFYSIATDALILGRNQQLADLMDSEMSLADSQGVNYSTGAITKPTVYRLASPTVMRGSENATSKGEYDNYKYYGYAIYNGMTDSTSYAYDTRTGLHAATAGTFASFFTPASSKDYGNTGVVNQKICTCCGQAYTGTSCPNCTNTRCSVCGKCPNHCTCQNTDLVTDDHIAYVSGYPDGTFRPAGTLTRAEAAQIFYCLLQNKNYISSKYFSDVNHKDWYYTAVSCLASKGIVAGYPDGCYHPGWKVTRAEFCVMAAKFTSIKSGTVHFADVPTTHWAYKYIASAVAYGYISDGYGYYYPNKPITRQEVVLFANNMTGRIPDEYFIDSNYGNLNSFSDVPRGSANYYAIMEAANNHTFVQKSGVETWKKLTN